MDSHEDKTTMPVFDDAQERGSTLLIALLLTLGLTLFGMSVLQRSLIEDTVSLHNTASTQALLTADAAVELAIPWLSYDYLVDPNGWSNEYLFVPAPPGTWPAGLLQDDAAGSVTGVPDTFYYDLRDANSDGTADQVVPNSQPYQVPEGAPFALSDELLPMGGFKVGLRNLSDNTNPGDGSPVSFRRDQIVLRVEGSSEDLADPFGTSADPSKATLEVVLGNSIHSIWDNAMFSDGPVGSLANDIKLHGSVHVIGKGGSTAIALEGTSQILNNYDGLNATLAAAVAPLVGNPISLNAEVRVRSGRAEINSGAATVGEADASTPAGIKDSLDGAYLAQGAFAGTNPGNHWTDFLEDYDMLSFEFVEMMEDQAFTDLATSTTYDSYYEYLRGSNDGSGVSGLDISFWNIHGGSKGNVSLNRASAMLTPDQAFAEQLERRYDLLVDNAFLYAAPGTRLDVYIEQADGSWGQETYLGPGGAPAPTPGIDVTGVVAILKEVPEAIPGSSNPFPEGYRHGFIWIPPAVTVGAAGAAIIQWMIDQMNEYLDSTIPSPVDPGTGTILPSADGRLFGSGVILVHRLFMNRGVIQNTKTPQPPAYITGVRYAGAFSIISEHISEMAGDLLPLRTFPCDDAIGVASTEDVVFDETGILVAGAFYAEKDAQIEPEVEIAGAVIAGDTVKANGPGIHLAAVPALMSCLPPYLPDAQIQKLEYRSWTSIW